MPTTQGGSYGSPHGTPQSCTTTQIDLLQQAIDLLKTHALEAATNLTRLKSLMAEEQHLDPTEYKRLQRERWLEERRELDATKALWSTCQQAEAIAANDQAFFLHQRKAKERKHRWYQMQEAAERVEYGLPVATEPGHDGSFYPLPRSRRREATLLSSDTRPEVPIPTAELGVPAGNQLIPLALACKADPEALQPKRGSSASSVSSSSTSSSNSTSNLRTPINLASSVSHLEDADMPEDEQAEEHEESDEFSSGTVTIFRSNGPGTVRKARKPSTSSTFRRFAEQELADVAMPAYVADLLSEFDGQTSVPALSLEAPSSSFSGLSLLTSPPVGVDLTRSPSPPPTITSPKSAPSSPARSRRALKRMPSTKRISGFFNKRPSMSSLRQSESPYPLHATQIPSRLGSSIDLVIPEESSFGLPLNFEDAGRTSGGFTSPSLSQGNWSSSPTNPSGLNPKRYSDSMAGGVSMVSLMSSQESATSDTTSMPPPPPPLRSAPVASSSSLASLDKPSAGVTPVAQPPSSPESSKFAARLKKRMSALRF